jgi:hypothetical protein
MVSTPKGQARSGDQVFTVEKDGKVRRVVKSFSIQTGGTPTSPEALSPTGQKGNKTTPAGGGGAGNKKATATPATTPGAKGGDNELRKRKRKDSVESGKSGSSGGAGPSHRKEVEKSEAEAEPSKSNQPEPIRANVKRTLQELLTQRVKEDPEVKITNNEVYRFKHLYYFSAFIKSV